MVDWHMSWITGEISERFDVDKNTIEDAFGKFLHDLDCGKITESEFWSKVGSHCSSEQLQNISESLWDTYFRKNAIPNNKLIAISNTIKEQNFATGVLSNIEHVTHCVVQDWNVLDNFEHKFFSYEIGYSKPDSEIYQHVIDNLPFLPNEILFIDDKKINIAKAQNAGLVGIHFNGVEELENNLRTFGILN